jgi:hypothetical protein
VHFIEESHSRNIKINFRNKRYDEKMEIGTIFQIPEEKLKINFFKSKSECRSTASAVEQKNLFSPG